MPVLSNRQALGRKVGLLRGGGNENADPESLSTVLGTAPETPKPASRSPKVQIIENDSRIAELEARMSVLEAEVLQLRQAHDTAVESFSFENKSLLDQN
jgi:hypothetical protein